MARQIAENMSSILDGGSFIGVMNSPDLSVLKNSPLVVPFVQLAERIGCMQAQLLGSNKISSLTINLIGKDVADSKVVDVIKASFLKGVLSVLQDAYSVSYVNATSIAEELGLVVTVNATSSANKVSGYVNEISVDMEMEGFNLSRNVKGTVFGISDIRVTEVDGYSVDLPSGDYVLLFNNNDKPGVLRKIAEKLYSVDVNIDHFSLGRLGLAGSKAMGAITINKPLSVEMIQQFKKKPDLGISNIVQVRSISNLSCHRNLSISPLVYSLILLESAIFLFETTLQMKFLATRSHLLSLLTRNSPVDHARNVLDMT